MLEDIDGLSVLDCLVNELQLPLAGDRGHNEGRLLADSLEKSWSRRRAATDDGCHSPGDAGSYPRDDPCVPRPRSAPPWGTGSSAAAGPAAAAFRANSLRTLVPAEKRTASAKMLVSFEGCIARGRRVLPASSWPSRTTTSRTTPPSGTDR